MRTPVTLLALVLCFAHAVSAAPGDLDLSFNGTGKVTTAIGASHEAIFGVAAQSDGKIVAAGYSSNGSNHDFAVARYTSAGALDGTFGAGGKVTTAVGSSDDIAYCMTLQSDGKIVVAGYSHNGTNRDFAVVRYTSAGALDGGFGVGGKVITPIGTGDDSIYGVAVQSDGKIVVAGYSVTSGNFDFAAARYTSTGVLDSSFGVGGKVTTPVTAGEDFAYSVAVQSDGKIVVGGYVRAGTNRDFAVVRYTNAGALDGSFGVGGTVITAVGSGDDTAFALVVQSDGKIVLSGSSFNGSDDDFALVRCTSTGALDGSFGIGGKVATPIGSSAEYGYSLALQSDGKIVVGGHAWMGSHYDFALARYTTAGVLDSSFGSGGKTTTFIGSFDDIGLSVALQSDGKIVVAGSASVGGTQDFALVRYLGDPGPPPSVTLSPATAVTSASASLNGTVNPHGSVTTAQFEYGLTTSFGSTATVTLSPNNGSTAQNVSAALSGLTPYTLYYYRLTATNGGGAVSTAHDTFFTGAGTLDLTFNGTGKVTSPFGGGTDDIAHAVAVQSDGKIVVAGDSYSGGNADFAVARYTSTGLLDSSFGTGGKIVTPIGPGDDYGLSVAVQTDGKILVAGQTWNGSNIDIALLRYTSAGVLDATFGSGGIVVTSIGGGNDHGYGVVVQSDGNIVVAGTSWNGLTYDFAVVRYTSTGALDASFGAGGKVTTPVGSGQANGFCVAVQSDGKIVVAGQADDVSFSDVAVVRYTSAGALDVGFGTGGKVIAPVGTNAATGRGIALQPDGMILVAGLAYGGSSQDFALVRFTSGGALDSTFGTGGKVTTPLGVGTGPAFGRGVALQSNGKIVVAGHCYNGANDDFALVRYTSAGALDSAFGIGGKVITPVGTGYDDGYGVALQSDGKIVVAGYSYNGSNNDFAVVRYLGDGSVSIAGPVASALGDVVTESPAPDGTGAADGTQFDQLQRSGYLAQNGTLAFLGYLNSSVGGVDTTNFMAYWKHDGSTLKRLARQGFDAPETGVAAAKFNILPFVPGINDAGQVTLFCSLLQSGLSTPPTTANNDIGLWSELGDTGFQILIREDDAIPGLGGPKVDSLGYGCFATAKTGAGTGEAAFVVGMKGASTDTALLRTSVVNSNTTAVGVIARENTTAPGAGENFGGLDNTVTRSVRMDGLGNVCFAAYLPASGKTGIWYQDQLTKNVRKVVLTGETAPSTTTTFAQLDLPNMGGEGVFAFRGVLNTTGDNADNSKNDGIWKYIPDTQSIINVIRRGDSNTNRPGLFGASYTGTYPNIKAGNIYNGWLTNASFGAWLGWVDLGGDGISAFPYDGNFTASTDTFGIYTDVGGPIKLLIASGDDAPGIAGSKFFFIDHPVCGGAEQVAFIATVNGGGVSAGINDKGIWRTGSNGSSLALALRTGDTMSVSVNGTPTTKTIADLDIPGSGYAEHIWETPVMDGTGRLLIFVTFTDGTTSQVLVP